MNLEGECGLRLQNEVIDWNEVRERKTTCLGLQFSHTFCHIFFYIYIYYLNMCLPITLVYYVHTPYAIYIYDICTYTCALQSTWCTHVAEDSKLGGALGQLQGALGTAWGCLGIRWARHPDWWAQEVTMETYLNWRCVGIYVGYIYIYTKDGLGSLYSWFVEKMAIWCGV